MTLIILTANGGLPGGSGITWYNKVQHIKTHHAKYHIMQTKHNYKNNEGDSTHNEYNYNFNKYNYNYNYDHVSHSPT
jgi:hypothetical protein